ncbi:nuclear transport factor 2 family protein [Flavobacterium sp. IMCC34852]|uniref:Nuclear transport factor 2 family protein n=1 Tax=Flavobacterium rivulicola TaxID=2732161 RepID=A0A7Y3R987_9FLAO|nr:nuclear transport factor 2 family protein [Flavobacterium sp. IMCC34852]NNT72260.1 nuclear transport factor 2 family protein [Flavobacterium sp. IMCC34852]
MKNKILKGTILGMISILFFACQPKKEEAVAIDKEQIKNEIQALENKMAEMFNDRNVNAGEYYADDAVTFSQNKPPIVGKMEIEKSIKADLNNFPKGYQIAFVVNEILPSTDGNQVVEIGNYRVSDSTSAPLYTGNYIAVFEKRDGKYLCVRDMSASDKNKNEEAEKE